MQSSFKFFSNTECEYYPCHEGNEELNCLFCFCPMYSYEDCLGNPKYLLRDGKKIKSCVDCSFPHKPESYAKIMDFLKQK